MILLEDVLPGLLPIGQVGCKSFLPTASKKIYLSWTSKWHFLGILYLYTYMIFKQFLLTFTMREYADENWT